MPEDTDPMLSDNPDALTLYARRRMPATYDQLDRARQLSRASELFDGGMLQTQRALDILEESVTALTAQRRPLKLSTMADHLREALKMIAYVARGAELDSLKAEGTPKDLEIHKAMAQAPVVVRDVVVVPLTAPTTHKPAVPLGYIQIHPRGNSAQRQFVLPETYKRYKNIVQLLQDLGYDASHGTMDTITVTCRYVHPVLRSDPTKS